MSTHPDAVHDPEDGLRAPCPCGGCGNTQPGVVAGWHARLGPGPVLRRLHDLHPWALPTWVDHAYRLRLPDGRWRWVAEPYQLHDDALADLAALTAADFTVTVTAWRARHYPGHTLAVVIDDPEDAPA